jgi:hypothetical protein
LKTLLKSVLLTSALLTSSLAFSQTPAQGDTASKFYVGANVNYTHSDWKAMLGANGTAFTDWKNGTGGVGFGAYAGYMLTNHIGAELGWNKSPTVDVSVTYTGPKTATKISTNMFYAAFVMANKMPGVSNLSMFLKVGPGFQKVHINNDASGLLNSMTAVGLYGATGVTYAATPNIGISLQAAGLSGQTDHNKGEFSTNPYIYSLSVAYLF